MLEIVLTLEATVDHMKLEEEGEGQGEELVPPSNTLAISSPAQSQVSQQQQQQQQPNQPLSRKHSDLSPLPSEMTDGPIPSSPPHTDSDSSSQGGPVRRKHSRGRSVTSKAEMMSRPNSAKASYNPPQQQGSKDHAVPSNRPTSPIQVRETDDADYA